MIEILRLKDKKVLLLLFLTVLWMGIIFFFSSQPGDDSAKVSSFVAEKLFAMVRSLFGTKGAAFLRSILENHYIIRKGGHFTEYFVLGILTASLLKRLGTGKFVIISLGVCILYAASDEFHQMFVPGRGPGLGDVLLDTTAAVIGCLLIAASSRKKEERESA